MNKILLVCCIGLALTGCVRPEMKPVEESSMFTYKVIAIDGCQYIQFADEGYDGKRYIIHKGNCNNPEHKRNGN